MALCDAQGLLCNHEFQNVLKGGKLVQKCPECTKKYDDDIMRTQERQFAANSGVRAWFSGPNPGKQTDASSTPAPSRDTPRTGSDVRQAENPMKADNHQQGDRVRRGCSFLCCRWCFFPIMLHFMYGVAFHLLIGVPCFELTTDRRAFVHAFQVNTARLVNFEALHRSLSVGGQSESLRVYMCARERT